MHKSLYKHVSSVFDHCGVCVQLGKMQWHDEDLNLWVCDNCAGYLSLAERALLSLGLVCPGGKRPRG